MIRENGRTVVTAHELATAVRQLLLDAEEQWIVDYDAFADPEHKEAGRIAAELSTVVNLEDMDPVRGLLCVVLANGDSFMLEIRPDAHCLHS